MKIKLQSIGAVLSILALACPGFTAQAQDSHEDLSACPGSAPEPAQSATWSVAFCNRTGHDVVIEFHDNDCPINDWTRRGDVYQRTLKRGESRTLPLCYANEAGKKPAPGTPTLHLPGGKGVTTTWSVVGDCGDHSKPLNMDARSFYDRGDYKTGIILLQSPSSASHCTSDAAPGPAAAAGATAGAADSVTPSPYPPGAAPSGATSPGAGARNAAGSAAPTAAASGAGAASAAATSAASAAQQPVATHSPIVAPPASAAPPAVPRTNEAPTLTASVDTSGLIQHRVQVFAKGGANYKCNFNLLVTFSDGATWNDKVKTNITGNDEQVPIVTRKYLKTPTDVKITSNNCAP
ncbi:MAG: hypothetical protein JSR66_12495 [Proteobacteria bacterium]|nr:hypothetical protein [Pseudomonadota bacterium]